MLIEYKIQLPPFDDALFQAATNLCEAVFKQPVKDISWRLENMPCPRVICARISGQLVGFKAGYAMSQSKYYSWLGGVHPTSQRQGIASRLMELQHEFLSAQGFEVIETAILQCLKPTSSTASPSAASAMSRTEYKCSSPRGFAVPQAPNPSIERDVQGLSPSAAPHVKR